MPACRCEESKKPIKDRAWEIRQYMCNYSAFNGSRYTPSDYSSIICHACRAYWRTKAKFVRKLAVAKR